MTAYKFVVLTNAIEGREAEFNDWYTNRHLEDVLDIPGIVAAQRFKITDAQRAPKPLPYNYLAIYEIETDDLAGVVGELGRRAGTGKMPISDAMHPQRISYIVEAITDRMTSK
jgi:hypothetical protein